MEEEFGRTTVLHKRYPLCNLTKSFTSANTLLFALDDPTLHFYLEANLKSTFLQYKYQNIFYLNLLKFILFLNKLHTAFPFHPLSFSKQTSKKLNEWKFFGPHSDALTLNCTSLFEQSLQCQ